MTDHQIINLFWNRDEDAIAETDAQYGRKLRSLSRRILQNPEDSEEVVNDTYMKTWSSIPNARPQYFYAYIAAICRHLSLNLLNWNQAAKRHADVVSLTEESRIGFHADNAASGVQNLLADTPIDLEQVSYLLLPDGTKLMAP